MPIWLVASLLVSIIVGSYMKLCALVIVFLSSYVAQADAQSSGQALAGAGTVSCGKYLSQKSESVIEHMTVSWAQGFLSGMNMTEYVTTKEPFVLLPDSDSIAAYIEKYCRDNPLESPMGGVIQLYHDLRQKTKY